MAKTNKMTTEQMHSRIAGVVDSLSDFGNASEVVLCLVKALEIVIILAAHDKNDAMNTADDVVKDMRRDIKKGYEGTRMAWAEKFPEPLIH